MTLREEVERINQDLSEWNVDLVTDMSAMFKLAAYFNQDISSWDVSNAKELSFMFDRSDLSSVNYDSILTEWSSLALQQQVQLGALGINYCAGEAARQSIVDTYNWTITDVGLDCTTTNNYVSKTTKIAAGFSWPYALALNENELFISDRVGKSLSKINITENLPLVTTILEEKIDISCKRR